MKDFLSKILDEPTSQPRFKFVPQIKISPKSTLHLEIQPNDPHTASNIVVNAFQSKTNRSIVPIRVQWSRFKFKSDEQYTVQKIASVIGNTYMCEPSDLGSVIQARVRSIDPMIAGEAQATIGPIRIDPMLKRLIDGALYSGSLLSQIIIVQGEDKLNVNLRLTKSTMQFTETTSQQKLLMPYSFSQPKLQLSPKDPCKVYYRFQQDTNNTVRSWLNKLQMKESNSNYNPHANMNESSMSIKVPHSNYSSVGSKARLFQKQHVHCLNKLEVRFMSRNSRDLFLFTLRAFICLQDMRNSIILQRIQTLQTLKSQQDYDKFLQYISLKSQIIRLAQIAKQLQLDRDSKVKDITNMQQSISEMTLTYLKIIQQKSQQQHVDLQQSYSMISIKRQQILGRKQLRQLKTQNQQLKAHIRQLNQQIQLQKFFKKDQNQSMLFNQTANPFMKKNNISGIVDQHSASYYLAQKEVKLNDPSHKNMLEISKSYLKVLEENQKLKSKSVSGDKHVRGQDESRDIQNLLESLHESEQQEKRLSQMQHTIEILKRQLNKLAELNNNLMTQNNQLKTKLSLFTESRTSQENPLINTSNQNSRLEYSCYSKSNIQNNSIVSNSYISMNESMTSQVELGLLEKKLIQLSDINAKFQSENSRLRRERDYFRSLYDGVKSKSKVQVNKVIQSNQERNKQQNLDESNLLNEGKENSVIINLRQDKQRLQNQKNSLLKKIQSLTRQSTTLPSQSQQQQRKYQQLSRQLQHQRQQNQTLSKTIQNMKAFYQLQKREMQNIQKREMQNNSRASGSSSVKEVIAIKEEEIEKLKKVNANLLGEIKEMRISIERKNDNQLDNSTVIDLQNQLHILKKYNQGKGNNQGSVIQLNPPNDQLVKELTQLRKENQRLQQETSTLYLKIKTQTGTIEKLMSEIDQLHQQLQTINTQNSFSKKYLTQGQSKSSDSSEVERYKKKISQMEEELSILRRNTEAVNRSRDLSMSMMGYEEERLQLYKKENESLMFQIQNLNKMCSKYSRDARQANIEVNKLREKISTLMKEKFLLAQ